MNVKFAVIKYIIFMIICTFNISCNYKKNIHNILNEKHINHTTTPTSNAHSVHIEKFYKEIQKLKDINIVYFNFDQYNILPQFFHILNQHVEFLKKNQHYKIIIEGHADERGTPEYNIALGERRANSVKIYLQSQGITDNQIFLISYGKEKPICFGHTESDYAKNRRAILVY